METVEFQAYIQEDQSVYWKVIVDGKIQAGGYKEPDFSGALRAAAYCISDKERESVTE